MIRVKRRTPLRAGRDGAAGLRHELEAIACNIAESWTTSGRLWELLAACRDARGGARGKGHPAALVRSASTGELRRFAEDPECRKALAEARGALSHAVRPAKPPASLSRSQPVAYFSMEFGVHEALPVYAGGLGILAGDHAKSASDEAVPFVGVGLFYHCGYFRQELDGAGHQRVLYPKADPSDLPLEAARDAQGRELLVPVELEDRTIRARVWRLRVGRVDLLLLDTNVQGNSAADRRINDRLYGGTREDRIRQEVVAGIGGVRALRALGIHPGVWHLNEGHVSFITLERIREARSQGKLSFAEAVELVAADTVFTTHTPVPEGNEVFDLALARRYLSPHAKAAKIAVDDYLSLGLDSGPDGRPFLSMTVLAIRLSRFRNGVSALHGEVSRRMWGKLWPGFRWEDAPITSVTNGVHTSSWVAPSYRELYRRVLGKGWESRLDDRQYWRRRVPALRESDLFRVKQACKRRLVDFVREREMARLRREGRTEAQARSAASQLLDPEIFTIGFARRFALYKRSALLFRDLERAKKLFTSPSRPIQIVFAGKPHPEDPAGKGVFERIAAIASRKELRGRVVLLENYDIAMAQVLVQGVDLWLNNPRRPLEASGTSGQKVPVNAGLNLSILDGWWCEGFAPHTGWAFGKTTEAKDPEARDAEDAADLYRALEGEVLPLYYRRDRNGVPVDWFRKVKTAMAELVPQFSTSHMVLEYARRLYRPALENGERARARKAKWARELAAYRSAVEQGWPLVHVRGVRRKSSRQVEIELFAGGLSSLPWGCLDDRGRPCRVAVRPAADAATLLLRSTLPSRDIRTLRAFPTHPALVHAQELGLSIEIVL